MMSDKVAVRKGERVQDQYTGKTICRVARDINFGEMLTADQFEDFAEGEEPWKNGDPLDVRCFRNSPHSAAILVYIEGEWK